MKIIVAVFALFFSTLVSATSLNKIVVFGDSLSDDGNLFEYMKHQLPLSPPYYKGRFTNGPVWIEIVASHYFGKKESTHFLDYAFGGAGISEEVDQEEPDESDDPLFTLNKEIQSYLLAHQDKADENALFVVWIGSNNYLAIPDDNQKSVDDVINGIEQGLKTLANKGAKHILVVNLPDLGRTPMAVTLDAVNLLTAFSKNHNSILEQKLKKLKIDYPHVQWIPLNVHDIMDRVLLFPQEYGFSDITNTCYEAMIGQPTSRSILKMASTIKPHANQDACDGYLFFDLVHPSGAAHKILAEKTIKIFDQLNIHFNQ